MLGLVLRACLALGIREPLEFFDLSESAQDLWIAHARNEFAGTYLRAPKKPGGVGDDKLADFRARAVAAAKARGAL